MTLKVGTQIEQRQRQQFSVNHQQHNEQTSDAPIAIQKGMDRFKLIVDGVKRQSKRFRSARPRGRDLMGWIESGLGSCSPTSFEVRVTLRELRIVDPDNLSLPKLTSDQQDIGNDHNPALVWLLSFQEAG